MLYSNKTSNFAVGLFNWSVMGVFLARKDTHHFGFQFGSRPVGCARRKDKVPSPLLRPFPLLLPQSWLCSQQQELKR